MFSTSHDILLLTIAACVAAFTIFLCWGMYYLVAMARNFFKIVKDIRRIIDKAEGVVDALKEKINSSAGYLYLIGEGLKKIVEIAKAWHAKQGGEECECDDDEECDCQECAEEKAKEEKPRKVKVKEK
ncbi:MAG: hypothetical protein PHE24_04295 [Patescibacteria group bacterium]|nr:hypothetical protein [Patescibacteria group bacterium]